VLDIEPFSTSIQSGQTVCLTGASGSGKSMLLRSMADLIPHQGELYLNESACSKMKPSEWRKRVAYSSAESAWWQDTVGEHFMTPPEPPLLFSLGFQPDVLNWSISRLSSGEKQRLALTRILTNKPEILLLDEPTASLDAENIERVESVISNWQERYSCAVLWVSHQKEQIERIADRVFKLEHQAITELEQ
jgi:ABC-type iron transport system FetAB ATPase subunit